MTSKEPVRGTADMLINKILNNDLSSTDLVNISNRFTYICGLIDDVDKVFAIMTEEYLTNVIENILRNVHIGYEKGLSNNKKRKYLRKFEDYGKKYLSQFSVNTVIKHLLKLQLLESDEIDMHILLNFLDYDIANNYSISTNNNIIDRHLLLYKPIKTDMAAHYIILMKSRFVSVGKGYEEQTKNLINAACFNADCMCPANDYGIILVDLYSKSSTIPEDKIENLINVAIRKNYYDIFIDCYNTGYVLTEGHFRLHLEKFRDYYSYIYPLKNPFKILEHFCKIEKFQLKLNDKMSNALKLRLSEVIDLFGYITFDDAKKFYENNNYINVSKYNYNKEQMNILYDILFRKYTEEKISFEKYNFVTTFVEDTCVTHHIFREMFKKSTLTQIKKYMKLHKLKIDKWCIDNVFISGNTKIRKILIDKKIYPTSSTCTLLLEGYTYTKIKEHLNTGLTIENIDIEVVL